MVEPGTDPGVPTIKVPMHDVMAEIAAADLVKIDIEGGEWEILSDERFRREPPRGRRARVPPPPRAGAAIRARPPSTPWQTPA